MLKLALLGYWNAKGVMNERIMHQYARQGGPGEGDQIMGRAPCSWHAINEACFSVVLDSISGGLVVGGLGLPCGGVLFAPGRPMRVVQLRVELLLGLFRWSVL